MPRVFKSSRSIRWLALALACCCVAQAAGQQTIEYQVKAAFLLNFTRFVDWPPADNADSTIAICILGDDPFGDPLDQIVAGETLQGRKILVRRVRRPVAASCEVLYINRNEKDLPGLLAMIPPGTLTVGEGDTFLRDGGMIAFVIDGRRVRFDISQGAATKAGIRLSSKLLNVARSVEK
jgi:hypothetical protein